MGNSERLSSPHDKKFSAKNMLQQVIDGSAIDHLRVAIPKATRREIVNFGLEFAYPVEIDDPLESLPKLNTYLTHDFGAVGLGNHFSTGDPPRYLSALIRNCPEMRKRKLVAPVAFHQLDKPDLLALGFATDLIMPGIKTPHTKYLEKEREEHGLGIPWRVQPEREAAMNFLQISGNVLAGTDRLGNKTSNRGIVVYAPHAQRTESFTEFGRGSISTLDAIISRKKITENVVYFFWALQIPGEEDYSILKSGGSNLRIPYTLSMGPVLLANEFHTRADTNNRTLEEEAHAIMLDLVPESYKPR